MPPTKSNFSPLQSIYPALYEIGISIERQLNFQPDIAMVLMRKFFEGALKIYINSAIYDKLTLGQLINYLATDKIIDLNILKWAEFIQKIGNNSAHYNSNVQKLSNKTITTAYRYCYLLAKWLIKESHKNIVYPEFNKNIISESKNKTTTTIPALQTNTEENDWFITFTKFYRNENYEWIKKERLASNIISIFTDSTPNKKSLIYDLIIGNGEDAVVFSLSNILILSFKTTNVDNSLFYRIVSYIKSICPVLLNTTPYCEPQFIAELHKAKSILKETIRIITSSSVFIQCTSNPVFLASENLAQSDSFRAQIATHLAEKVFINTHELILFSLHAKVLYNTIYYLQNRYLSQGEWLPTNNSPTCNEIINLESLVKLQLPAPWRIIKLISDKILSTININNPDFFYNLPGLCGLNNHKPHKYIILYLTNENHNYGITAKRVNRGIIENEISITSTANSHNFNIQFDEYNIEQLIIFINTDTVFVYCRSELNILLKNISSPNSAFIKVYIITDTIETTNIDLFCEKSLFVSFYPTEPEYPSNSLTIHQVTRKSSCFIDKIIFIVEKLLAIKAIN